MKWTELCRIVVGMLLVGSVAGVSANTLPAAVEDLEAESPRHLIYLHGRIVQETQSLRPEHPQFGVYEVDKILDAFRDRGFVVTGEIRPESASVSDSANRVVEQVQTLLASGVPADRIIVVGGSMGAAIALNAAARLENPEVRFAVLGTCLSHGVRGLLSSERRAPSGRVLAVRETSDAYTDRCPPWRDSEALPDLVSHEIILDTGLSHGFLYRPLPEWVDPVVKWAGASAEP